LKESIKYAAAESLSLPIFFLKAMLSLDLLAEV